MLMRGGIKDPPVTALIGLAKLFGVSLDDLVGFKPLQIPDAPVQDDDRLQSLESRFDKFEVRFQEVVDALGDFAQPKSQQRPGGKRQRAS